MEKKRLLAGVVTASMLFAMSPAYAAEVDMEAEQTDVQTEITDVIVPQEPATDEVDSVVEQPAVSDETQKEEFPAEGPDGTEAEGQVIPDEDDAASNTPSEDDIMPETPVEDEVPEEIPVEEVEAQAEEVSLIESLSFQDTEGNQYTTVDNGTSSYIQIPKDKTVDFGSLTMTTAEQVVFVASDHAGQENTMYASEGGADAATVSLNLKYHPNYPMATAKIAMERKDSTTWEGTGLLNVGGLTDLTNLTIGQLAEEMNGQQIEIVSGMMQTANGDINKEAAMYICSDADNVYFMVYETDAAQTLCTITYDCGEAGSFDLAVPSGSYLVDAAAANRNGYTFDSWCTDADCTTAADFNESVTADMTLYAKYMPDGTVSGSFDDALEAGAAILPITTAEDFDAFAAKASDVTENQRVVLQSDLDLNGETYIAITGFKGDFDGQNYTISNAAFTKVGENAGMFATLGAGQVVANLNLDNITVDESSATYAGTLVGSAGGVESGGSGQVTIQNVHITNCDVHGRSAGGIAGFIIWTDVKYCSVQSGTVAGSANGGGIAGISYGNITDCYAMVSPTALPFFGKTGGIVGKGLESSRAEHCWTTTKVYGQLLDGGVAVECLAYVDDFTYASDFEDLGFDSIIWNLQDGTDCTLNATEIVYDFGEEAV